MNITNNENLWTNENYIYEEHDGFLYGFENESCREKFLSLKLEKWHLCIRGKIVNILRRQGWKVFVCDEIEEGKDSAGMCFYKERTITVRNMDPMPNSFFHEIGHVITAYAKGPNHPLVDYAIALEATQFCAMLAGYYLKGSDHPDILTQNLVMSQMTYFLTPAEYMAQSIALTIYGYKPFFEKCPLTASIVKFFIEYYDGGKEEIARCERELGLT